MLTIERRTSNVEHRTPVRITVLEVRLKQHLHSWDVTPGEAIEIQKRLRSQVVIQKCDREIKLVAGADISFNRFSDTVYAAVVVLRLPQLSIETAASAITRAKFPYIPGLLSFREGAPLLEAWEKLSIQPDAVMFDGQGLAHPRRFGIASHMGVILGIPSVGCAKSLLVGKYEEPAVEAGSYSLLIDRGEVVGAALRTKERVNPVFISPGHLIDLEDSIKLALRCLKGYRIPEPTRQAHLLVNEIRRGAIS